MKENNMNEKIKIFSKEMLKTHFELLENCKGIEQEEMHHPEGDVFNHTLQVLKWAFRESEDTDLILAALLHDVGKPINRLGHDKVAVELIIDITTGKTLWLVENHMRVWHFILGEMKKLSKVKELAEHMWLPELILLARWDKLGRNPRSKIVYDKDNIVERLNKCVGNRYDKNKEN